MFGCFWSRTDIHEVCPYRRRDKYEVCPRGYGKSMKTPHGASLLDMVGGLGVTDIHEVCPYRRRFLSLKTPRGASLLHFVVEF